MSGTDPDLPELLGELIRSTKALRREVDPTRGRERGRLRPPGPRELARFTSEVTIPAIVLALETNVRALRLLQRALRIADGREPRRDAEGAAGERAADLGRATLSRLDDVLSELGAAVEGRPPGDEAQELLDRVEQLQAEVETRLAEAGERPAGEDRDSVNVDVDAELQSLKDEMDDPDQG